MMSSKLDWTTKLGDAVLAQQPDVMDAIQRLRARADANNKLASTKEQRVTKTQSQGGKQVIAIEQTNPETLYVPYYDPAVVYGGWPYPAYPPYYFRVSRIHRRRDHCDRTCIWRRLGSWTLGRRRQLLGRQRSTGTATSTTSTSTVQGESVSAATTWQHRPEHRGGVRYNNSNVRQQFGNSNRGSVQNRMDFRGRGGDQVLRPGGGRRRERRSTSGGRPDAGQRPSQRPSAGQRPRNGRARGSGRRSGRAPDSGPRQRPSAGRAAGCGRAAATRLATSVRPRRQSAVGARSREHGRWWRRW